MDKKYLIFLHYNQTQVLKREKTFQFSSLKIFTLNLESHMKVFQTFFKKQRSCLSSNQLQLKKPTQKESETIIHLPWEFIWLKNLMLRNFLTKFYLKKELKIKILWKILWRRAKMRLKSIRSPFDLSIHTVGIILRLLFGALSALMLNVLI